MEAVRDALAQANPTELLLLASVFASVLLLVLGTAAMLAPRDAIDRRLMPPGAQSANVALPLRQDHGSGTRSPLDRILMPRDSRERSQVRRILAAAGYRGPQALRNYYLVRTCVGLLLPLPLVVSAIGTRLPLAGAGAKLPVVDLHLPTVLLLAMALVAVGFYGPAIWIRRRVAARQQAVREGFPNALDLMQIAIEAGLAFDAALARVAEELTLAHPVLAEEFALVGLELRAGKPREQVLDDLARRTGVDEIGSFVTVINQSTRFGTSISDALEVFAEEMRHKRMMAAEEKANKLPVKMSAALVLFMLPAVLVVCLGPVVIRAIRIIFPAIQ